MRIIYLLFFAAIVAGIFFIPNVVKVKSIECVSQFGPCSNQISDKLSLYKGTSLKNSKKRISVYLRTDASIKDFSVRLKLPSTLLVSLLEKKSRFALKLLNEEVYAALGEDGEVLTIGADTPLPFIVIPGRPPNLGEKVSEEVLFALRLQERLYSAYQVRSGVLTEDFLKVTLPDGYTVLFPLEGDVDELLGALSLIVYELKRPAEGSRIGKERITVVDLRFKSPVLR